MPEIFDLNTCNKCAFAKLYMLPPTGAQQWICRRFPPQQTQLLIGIMPGPAGAPAPNVIPSAGFPMTQADWTCGEFKPAQVQ